MKNISYPLLLLLALSVFGCYETIIKSETAPVHRPNKWQPILLQTGEFFRYQSTAPDKKSTFISLMVKQDTKKNLQALWEVNQGEKIVLSKQVLASADNILASSKAALLTEKVTIPFLNTIVMSWWPKIDYFHWEIGFKRAVQLEMLAVFMIEVIDECEVADIKGFQVQLKAGKTLMAEACLSPTITFPLSVKRYDLDGRYLKYEVKLINYSSDN